MSSGDKPRQLLSDERLMGIVRLCKTVENNHGGYDYRAITPLDLEAAVRMAVEVCSKEAARSSYTPADVEAVKWAIALLAAHPGVKVNENSQMWLRRLRQLAGASEDELMVASVDGFLEAYCDGVVDKSGDRSLKDAPRPECAPTNAAPQENKAETASSGAGLTRPDSLSRPLPNNPAVAAPLSSTTDMQVLQHLVWIAETAEADKSLSAQDLWALNKAREALSATTPAKAE